MAEPDGVSVQGDRRAGVLDRHVPAASGGLQ